MKKIRFIVAVSVLCTLIVLSGCAGEGQQQGEATAAIETAQDMQQSDAAPQTTETQQAAALIQPEQLISQQEAETLLGVAVEAEKSDNAAVGQMLCFYSEAGTDVGKFLQICITQQALMPEGSINTPESIYQTTKEAFGGDAAVVDGPGDETILVSGGYYILCEGYLLQISAGNTDHADTIALLDAAGGIAVENLKAIIE